MPTLLFMKEVIENGFDIAIQRRFVGLGGAKHPLALENYFHIHRWTPTDTLFAIYTQRE